MAERLNLNQIFENVEISIRTMIEEQGLTFHDKAGIMAFLDTNYDHRVRSLLKPNGLPENDDAITAQIEGNKSDLLGRLAQEHSFE